MPPKKGYKKNPTRKPKAKNNGIKTQKTVINPALKSYVNRIVRGSEETKYNSLSLAYKSNITGIGFNTTGPVGFNSSFNILPVISQGTGQAQRVGNRVAPVGKLLIRGSLLALPTSAATNPCANCPFYVRVVIWRHKASMTTVTNSDILDDNITLGGTPFAGTIDDLMLPYNKDKYLIGASRTYKLQPNATVGTFSQENLSKYPVSRMFKIYVPLPKHITYNDLSADPSNVRWYMSAGVVNMDGSLLTTSSIRATLTAEALFKFKDA